MCPVNEASLTLDKLHLSQSNVNSRPPQFGWVLEQVLYGQLTRLSLPARVQLRKTKLKAHCDQADHARVVCIALIQSLDPEQPGLYACLLHRCSVDWCSVSVKLSSVVGFSYQ